MIEFSKKLVNDLRLESGRNTQKRRLITSFGKYGFYSIIDPKDSFEKRLTVSKYMGGEYFLMNFIYDTVKERTTDVTVLPSPLDDNMLDGFAFENSDIAILVGEPDTADICINEFMLPCTVIEKDYLNALNSYFVFLLDSAKDHFNAASIEHARLEEIYSSAMNFKTNDQKCNEIEQKIKDILEA
jgi:hypothetical protein